ncbi:hypothetical protein V6N13_094523 [Hibiscus sabdariffa]
MSVQEYLDKHMLSRKIEDAVNAAVRAKTPDPVLFISNHMKKAVPSVITKVKARQILDGRGIPTVEVDLFTNKGMFRASVPSGDSTGMYEAFELRDGDKGAYLGHAVTKAVRNINEKISEALKKKSELGANAILAVSIAACKAGAAEKEVPLYKHIADVSGKSKATSILPVPAFTVIRGGKMSGNSLPIKDIIILPTGASRFEEALQMGSETYHHLKNRLLLQKNTEYLDVMSVKTVASLLISPGNLEEGLDIVLEAIGRTGYNDRIKIGIDVAATEFCIGDARTKYDLEFKSPNKSGQNFKSGEDMIQMYKELCIGEIALQVVGDDLLMSNPKRIERASRESACNSLLLKINQIGTVTEAIDVEANWGVVVSHRYGETDDSFIADLAVALGAGQIKAGAPCRGERLAKYNQFHLLRIEEELGDQAVYAGEDWRSAS